MRLVASDLDGTVVRPDFTISDRTLAAFDACEAAGVDIVFVTGRPTRWMPPIAEKTGHRGLAICGNGATLYDLGTEQIVGVRALDRDAVLQVVDVLRRLIPDASFGLETLLGFRHESAFPLREDAPAGFDVGTVDELLADDAPVVKVLLKTRLFTADPMLALARPALAGIAEPVHSDGTGSMLEVSALGVSKASTLAEVVRERGIDPQDVVAFGDMPNDVPMLVWAGVGYAMSGGHPEAIAAADRIAPPCEEDGVAQVIESLLAKRLVG
jgi:hypothetical protein